MSNIISETKKEKLQEELEEMKEKNKSKNVEMTKLIQQRDGWAKKAEDWSYKAAEYRSRLINHGLYKKRSSSTENDSETKIRKRHSENHSIKTKLKTALQDLSTN